MISTHKGLSQGRFFCFFQLSKSQVVSVLSGSSRLCSGGLNGGVNFTTYMIFVVLDFHGDLFVVSEHLGVFGCALLRFLTL